ncbi:cora-domain-containing protein [Basidiobolus meristosporus CBS 931.73]|uniref:Magnesium transporter n=1 Tax=Basidiobolus meristosporus CBS 931.73 TaxID=1314790 RepID=A0A1Y1YDG7_9FUNG|nr:cora-domain-containing protein [Basidiobolus meristosporus CBS 931.73]|eukprot:ORX95776.1 cora-domain-containing protein [Basidiobolus meristosporus CBS 931.73]
MFKVLRTTFTSQVTCWAKPMGRYGPASAQTVFLSARTSCAASRSFFSADRSKRPQTMLGRILQAQKQRTANYSRPDTSFFSAKTTYRRNLPVRPIPTPASNQANELKLKCTEFDHRGNVKITAGEFSKLELCTQHGLQARDLRKIDSNFVNQMPAILVRKEAILVHLAHIRALIKADAVVLFDSYGSSDSYNQSIFIYDLQERLSAQSNKDHQLAFEFRALEAIMISVVSSLQSEMEVLVSLVTNLLSYLEESIDRDKLKELLQYSKRLSKFEQRTLNIRDAILEVLEQDEDLEAMYLTAKKEGLQNLASQSDDVELLLETYLKQVEEIANTVAAVSANTKTTEDIVNIILDSQRNNLLLLELKITMGTLGLGAGSFVACLFGMNLTSFYEDNPYAFSMVAGFSTILAAGVFVAVLRKMQVLVRQI